MILRENFSTYRGNTLAIVKEYNWRKSWENYCKNSSSFLKNSGDTRSRGNWCKVVIRGTNSYLRRNEMKEKRLRNTFRSSRNRFSRNYLRNFLKNYPEKISSIFTQIFQIFLQNFHPEALWSSGRDWARNVSTNVFRIDFIKSSGKYTSISSSHFFNTNAVLEIDHTVKRR